VCVCVTEVGGPGGGNTVVMHDLHTYYICTDNYEVDELGKQQAETDAIREQLRWSQLGRSPV